MPQQRLEFTCIVQGADIDRWRSWLDDQDFLEGNAINFKKSYQEKITRNLQHVLHGHFLVFQVQRLESFAQRLENQLGSETVRNDRTEDNETIDEVLNRLDLDLGSIGIRQLGR